MLGLGTLGVSFHNKLSHEAPNNCHGVLVLEANTGFYPLFLTGIPLSGYDLHHAVLNWEVDKVVAILEERCVTELTSCKVDSDVGAKEYETITGAFMGSMMILVKMPIGLFQLAQFVK